MFRYAYAIGSAEPSSLSTDDLGPFQGIEVGSSTVTGPIVGRRVTLAELATIADAPAYLSVAFPSDQRDIPTVGHILRQAAERLSSSLILVENSRAFETVAAMWSLMEAAGHERVKIAWDADAGFAAGQRAAVVTPTLNLGLGVLRIHEWNDQTADYARRLAGIGFEGWWTIDPIESGASQQQEGDRLRRAGEIVSKVRLLLEPPKPAKKTPTPAR